MGNKSPRIAPSFTVFVASLAFSGPAAAAESLSNSCSGSERVLVLRGACVVPIDGDPIAAGAIVVRGGRIAAVGPADRIGIPPGAEVRDLAGKWILPGLVDTHSHLGVYPRPAIEGNSDGNEGTGAVQGIVRAMDAVWPQDPGIRMALAGGITTVHIVPGSANVIGGQSVHVKLRGRTVEEMLIAVDDGRGGPGAAPITGGLKMANGENPKRAYGSRGESPSTRMGIAALQRGAFLKAREYRDRILRAREARAAGKDKDIPDRDLSLDPLVEVLEGRRIVHFHAHRADDILSTLRLGREFGFTPVIHHGTEAHLVAGELARAGAAASIILLESPGGKHEAAGYTPSNGAVLEKAGVKVAIHTDDPITDSRLLLRSAALAVRGGMSEAGALRAVTLSGAEILGLAARVGSITPGKDADLVVLSGPPLSVYTHILETWIDGEEVFDRSRSEDLRFATGGFNVRDRIPGPLSPPPPPPAIARMPQEASGAGPREAEGPGSALVLADWIFPVSGPPIRDGAIAIEGGRIVRVGRRADIAAPQGVLVLRAAAVTPGLIDAHSQVGLSGLYNVGADQDEDEPSEPNQAALRAIDGFNPAEPLLAYLLSQGITVIQCSPGKEVPIAGQAGIFRTTGRSAEAMAIRFPSGMVFNLGEEPKRTFGSKRKSPATRMGTAAVIRSALQEALNSGAKRARAAADPEKDPPEGNPRAEALGPVLAGKIPAIFSARREDDIRTALRLAREFGLRPILDLATEGYLMAGDLAREGVPVIAAPTLERIGSLETMNACLENAAVLARSGVRLAIQSGFEDYVPKTRVVRFEAAVAAANGLGFEGALRAITLDAARILAIDDRFGSIEPGKAADLVLFDGDPFEPVTRVLRVLVDGRTAWAP